MKYALAFPKFSNQPKVEFSGHLGMGRIVGEPAKVEWVIDESYGYFDRNVDAKRAYLIAMKEITGERSDEFIKLLFASHHRMGYVKVEKVRHLTKRSPDALRAYDMGEVNGVKLTYVNGNVFATPAKRR